MLSTHRKGLALLSNLAGSPPSVAREGVGSKLPTFLQGLEAAVGAGPFYSRTRDHPRGKQKNLTCCPVTSLLRLGGSFVAGFGGGRETDTHKRAWVFVGFFPGWWRLSFGVFGLVVIWRFLLITRPHLSPW